MLEIENWQKTKEQLIQSKENLVKEANEIFRELIRQLIIADTVLLSVLSFIFSNKDLIKNLSIVSKHLIAIAWIFLGLSLIFAIIHCFVDYYFFVNNYKKMDSLIEDIESESTLDKNIRKMREELKKESNPILVYLGVIFFILAIILLTSVMVKIIFDLK